MGDEKNNDAIEPSNNEIDKFPESEKKKKLIQDTSKDLIGSVNKTPRELANIAIQTLKETFGIKYDIVQDKGCLRYHVNKKGVPMKGTEGQMIFTIINSGLIRVRLNIYGSENKYFHIEGLSNDDFLAEIDTIKAFLFDGTLPPPTSKIKEGNTRGDFHKPYVDTSSVKMNIQKQDSTSDAPKNINENINKAPELTKQYYKISSLSESQKKALAIGETIDGWTKEELISYINNQKYTSIIIKKRIEGKLDDGYVREYVDSIPNRFKGVQLFTPAAAKNLGISDELPTKDQLLKMVGEKIPGDSEVIFNENKLLIKKFIQDNNLANAGMYSANSDSLKYIDGSRYHLLLKDNIPAEIDENADDVERYEGGVNKDHGYPIMLMKK